MLRIKNISFSYKNQKVLKSVSFSVKKGENVAIIGESGCGKSTLLKIIYGILAPDKGELFWEEKRLLGPDFNLVPGEPFIKYVAQDFDLMPYITVEENVGKYLSNFYPGKKRKRIKELLALVEMTSFAKTKAQFLSGGQKQRVAIIQALAQEPELVLLDEPFSNIDNFRKNSLRRNLFSYFKKNNISCIIATHDNGDSLGYADNTIVFKNGKIITRGTPEEVYSNPKTKYTASLFGEVNEIPSSFFDFRAIPGDKVLLYPHELRVVDSSKLKTVVLNSFFEGDRYLTEANCLGYHIFFYSSDQIPNGKTVYLDADYDSVKKRL